MLKNKPQHDLLGSITNLNKSTEILQFPIYDSGGTLTSVRFDYLSACEFRDWLIEICKKWEEVKNG